VARAWAWAIRQRAGGAGGAFCRGGVAEFERVIQTQLEMRGSENNIPLCLPCLFGGLGGGWYMWVP
jgi:hypothetical protein